MLHGRPQTVASCTCRKASSVAALAVNPCKVALNNKSVGPPVPDDVMSEIEKKQPVVYVTKRVQFSAAHRLYRLVMIFIIIKRFISSSS